MTLSLVLVYILGANVSRAPHIDTVDTIGTVESGLSVCERLQSARALMRSTCFYHVTREDGMHMEHLVSSVLEEVC